MQGVEDFSSPLAIALSLVRNDRVENGMFHCFTPRSISNSETPETISFHNSPEQSEQANPANGIVTIWISMVIIAKIGRFSKAMPFTLNFNMGKLLYHLQIL